MRAGSAIRKASGARRREAIDWIEKPKKVFDKDAGIYGRWFAGGACNTCYNALDRHVAAGRGDQAALIYDSPVTNTKQTFTYGRLLSEVQLLGAMLRDFGVDQGRHASSSICRWCRRRCSRMLACARIGAIHSVVFGGFAAKELATRIDDCQAESSSCRRAAASRARASFPTSRCSTRRSSSPSTSPRPA